MVINMETLKKFLQDKINIYVEILKIQMTKENIHEITYGDKLVALGSLSMAVDTMKQIDQTFEFNLEDETIRVENNYFAEGTKLTMEWIKSVD